VRLPVRCPRCAEVVTLEFQAGTLTDAPGPPQTWICPSCLEAHTGVFAGRIIGVHAKS
jgi:hypothetical protein